MSNSQHNIRYVAFFISERLTNVTSNNKTKKEKKLWNKITTVLAIIVVLCAVLLVGGKFIGIEPYAVLSGSMEPTYPTGSMIFVKDTPASAIEIGDPITFVLDENLTIATHRVVEIDAEEQHFITKGDANEYKDASPVHFNNLIGKPILSIPKLGYIVHYIQNPLGQYIAIVIAALILLLAFVPDLFDEEKKSQRKAENTKSSNTDS